MPWLGKLYDYFNKILIILFLILIIYITDGDLINGIAYEYILYAVGIVVGYLLFAFLVIVIYLISMYYFSYDVDMNKDGIKIFSKVMGVTGFYKWDEIEEISSIFRPPFEHFPTIILKNSREVHLRNTALKSFNKLLQKYKKEDLIRKS